MRPDSQFKTTKFSSLAEIAHQQAEMLRPPERISVSEAAEKYRKVNNPGSFVGDWNNQIAPYMVEPMNMISSRDHTNLAFVGPAQCGKPLALDTPVATPYGWTTIGELREGDLVFSAEGTVTPVTYVTPVFHDRPCFRIRFDDGSEIIADEEHRWAVNDCWGADPYARVVRNTGQLFRNFKITTLSGKTRNRFSIPNASPLLLPETRLELDPYTLGVWLGDGRANAASLSLNTADTDTIVSEIRKSGMKVKVFPGKANSAGTADRVALYSCNGTKVIHSLRKLEILNRKRIPVKYLRASIEQRSRLLKGLVDTDGTISSGRIEFTQSNKEMFEQVLELVRSLGFKPMVHADNPSYSYRGEKLKGQVAYTLSFCMNAGNEMTTLPRHLNALNKHKSTKSVRPTHTGRRFITDVSKVQSVPVKCVSVADENHLFLVGKQMVPTHNTDALIVNSIAYSARVDPLDTMIYCPTNSASRDFSMRRVDRLHRHSPEIGACLLPTANANNTFDKHYVSGMILTMSWPSVTEFAGRPVGRVILTDYDRMPDDVDGDGSPFDLADKRTTTFNSFRMCAAESSPSRPITDVKWIPKTRHEAPPCTGIMSLYNRGDRRRWYWPCPVCDEYFEGQFKHLNWRSKPGWSNLEIAETTVMICPHCEEAILPDERHEMQQWGVWVPDGMTIDKNGRLHGKTPKTTFASYWLRGTAASFVTWVKLVQNYLDAMDEYERTLSDEALKKFWNTDMGEPYFPVNLTDVRLPERLQERSEPLPPKMVPDDVRFLVATVDVQKNSFRVQVTGVLPGQPFDTVIVDSFEIRKSKRLDNDGERYMVKPAAYLDDWDQLVEEVMEKEYELADGSGRLMAIQVVGCDSGGKEGVTDKAYDFYRKLRSSNKHGRFFLLKGDSTPTVPRTRISYPDSQRKDNKSAARGDIPILMMNSNMLKDMLNNRLDVTTPGAGMFRMPDWLPDDFYAELCAETKNDKGKWENPNRSRNEAWDLSYYAIALCIAPKVLNIEAIKWDSPPNWAKPWDQNSLVHDPDKEKRFAVKQSSEYDFEKLASQLA